MYHIAVTVNCFCGILIYFVLTWIHVETQHVDFGDLFVVTAYVLNSVSSEFWVAKCKKLCDFKHLEPPPPFEAV